MKFNQAIRRGTIWAVAIAMCLPNEWALADEAAAPEAVSNEAFTVRDVALDAGGLLVGQIVDPQARPLAGAGVEIHAGGQIIARTATDENGMFAVARLRGGFHQLAAGDSVQNCRFWAEGTAPPSATTGIQLVEGSGVVRGQWGPPPLANSLVQNAKVWATNPFVVGGVIAAAVAIPVALNQDNGPKS